jgi:hypothetical protein
MTEHLHSRRLSCFVAVMALVIGLGGCAVPDTDINFRSDQAPQIFPANYRTDIVSFMRTYLNNPSQVRDAAITEPTQRSIGGRERYVACLRYNARNSAGRYTGASDRLAVFFEGRFDQLIERAAEHCSGAAYTPFPELEKLGATAR